MSYCPGEIAPFIDFMQGVCETIEQEKDRNREGWKHSIISFSYWLSLINEVHKRVRKFRPEICMEPQVFAGQLFSGDYAACSIYCLDLYCRQQRKHANQKFTDAVNLLFF